MSEKQLTELYICQEIQIVNIMQLRCQANGAAAAVLKYCLPWLQHGNCLQPVNYPSCSNHLFFKTHN